MSVKGPGATPLPLDSGIPPATQQPAMQPAEEKPVWEIQEGGRSRSRSVAPIKKLETSIAGADVASNKGSAKKTDNLIPQTFPTQTPTSTRSSDKQITRNVTQPQGKAKEETNAVDYLSQRTILESEMRDLGKDIKKAEDQLALRRKTASELIQQVKVQKKQGTKDALETASILKSEAVRHKGTARLEDLTIAVKKEALTRLQDQLKELYKKKIQEFGKGQSETRERAAITLQDDEDKAIKDGWTSKLKEMSGKLFEKGGALDDFPPPVMARNDNPSSRLTYGKQKTLSETEFIQYKKNKLLELKKTRENAGLKNEAAALQKQADNLKTVGRGDLEIAKFCQTELRKYLTDKLQDNFRGYFQNKYKNLNENSINVLCKRSINQLALQLQKKMTQGLFGEPTKKMAESYGSAMLHLLDTNSVGQFQNELQKKRVDERALKQVSYNLEIEGGKIKIAGTKNFLVMNEGLKLEGFEAVQISEEISLGTARK